MSSTSLDAAFLAQWLHSVLDGKSPRTREGSVTRAEVGAS